MRIGLLLGSVLIGLAICFGLVFVAGFPLMARLGWAPAYGAQPGYGMMPGGMPMQPRMGRVLPNQPAPTPAPNARPRVNPPSGMPGYGQMPHMPYGVMPMLPNQRGIWGGAFGGHLLGGWRFALSCLGLLAGAAAFTALGYALGRRQPSAPASTAAVPGPQAM